MPSEKVAGAWASPLSDPARVRAAAGLLADLPPTRVLDRLTALAARTAQAPHTHVAILTDELVVASRHGDPVVEISGRRLQQHALCAVTARGRSPVVITDTTRDPRSRRSPVVVDGRVRAYLGVPLIAADGTVVGSLCTTDVHPREWSADQVQTASDLAAAITTALEFAGVSAALTRLSERHELTLAAGDVGTFDWDLTTGRLGWDDRTKAMLGYDPESLPDPRRDDLVARIHPEDVDRVLEAAQHAQDTMGEYVTEYRVLLPDGTVRWLRARGRGLAGRDGRPERFVGAVHDISEVRAVESRLARMLETTPTPFVSLNPEFTITYVNPAAEQALRRSRADLQGRDLWQLFPRALGSAFEREYHRVLESGAETVFEAYEPDLEAWFEVRAWPTADGLSIYFNDVTERRHVEEERRTALRAKEEAVRTTERVAERLRMLAETSARMGVTLVEDEVVQVVLDALVPAVGPWAAVELYPDDTSPTRTTQRGVAPSPGSVATTASFRMRTRGERAVGRLEVALPDSHDVDRAMEDRVLTSLADRAGVAVDNARLYALQQSMSEALQRSMLTTLPTAPGLSLVARYRPAAHQAHVGGDWYDAFVRADGSVLLVIGDVMGHDRHAAAMMGQLRNLLRGLSIDRAAPAALLRGLDQAVDTMAVGGLATATVVRLQPPAQEPHRPRRMWWSNAGHLPPLVVRGDGTAVLLEGGDGDLMLGVDVAPERTEHSIELGPDDTLLMYTDGLVEQYDRGVGDGIAALVEAATKLAGSAEDLDGFCDQLLDAVAAERPHDDAALIAVRVGLGG